MTIREHRKPLTLSEQDRLSGTGEELGFLKSLRIPILKAFREYETDVVYGILSETEEEHAQMLDWYSLLTADDLPEQSVQAEQTTMMRAAVAPKDNTAEIIKSAIENIPSGVRRYLK